MLTKYLAANKDELLEMITHGADKIINSTSGEYVPCAHRHSSSIADIHHSFMVNGDIDEIIHRGEERTAELNSKYEGLNLEDLSNFKSEASVQQWEGEDFRSGVSDGRPVVSLNDTHHLLATQGSQS